MKYPIYLLLLVFGSLFLLAEEEEEEKSFFQKLKKAAQDQKKKMEGTDEENLKYFKEKYVEEFDNYFEDVYEVVKTVIEERGCQIIQETERTDNETGLLKGVIKSEECILAIRKKEEDVQDSLIKYSIKVPTIRGAIWENGRFQYKFILKETEDDTVQLILKGEMSGAEMNVTNEVHYWKSNGILEHFIIEDIKTKLADY